MFKLKLKVLLLTVVLLIAYPQIIAAQEATGNAVIKIEKESVTPDYPGEYQFKRLKEKIALFFHFSSESKADYSRELLRKRLAELKYVYEQKVIGEFEHATTRYFSQAGDLTTIIVSNNLKNQVEKTKSEMDLGTKVIQELQKSYPDEGMAEWRLLEDDVNYLKIHKESLNHL